jgi:hypothetical protein
MGRKPIYLPCQDLLGLWNLERKGLSASMIQSYYRSRGILVSRSLISKKLALIRR